MREVTGDGVEAAALPVPSPRGLAHRRASRWGLLAGMGRNSVRGDRGGLVPAEAAAEDPPLWSGAHAQGFVEEGPKPHAPPPLGGGGLRQIWVTGDDGCW